MALLMTILESDKKMKQENPMKWYSIEVAEIVSHFKSTTKGLTSADAKERLKLNGLNELKEAKKKSSISIFLQQFKSLIIWILIGAGIISGILGEVVDSIAILSIVFLNAALGFYQEFNAEKSIAALKKMTSPQAKVWRNLSLVVVPASEIVLGDILNLEAGDIVAADARLIEATSLKSIESALTGESESVSKNAKRLEDVNVPLADQENMLFMGTSIAAGVGQAIVIATGMKTEIGQIAELIQDADNNETTPLQDKLEAFGRILLWASLGIVVLIFVLGIVRGTPFFEMFMTSVSLAVAAIPEGLPAIVTIAFSLGVLRMSRRRALVRKLPAVETLGATNVICTDKTGTLTVGEMTVRVIYVAGQTYEVTGEGYEPKGAVQLEGKVSDNSQNKTLMEMANILVGCNNSHLVKEDSSWKVVGDPTEGAMLSAGLKVGANKEKFELEFPKLHEIPFDSDRKRRSIVRAKPNGEWRVLINGAPDVLLALCTYVLYADGVRKMSDEDRAAILEKNTELATKALRVLGSAYRDLSPIANNEIKPENIECDLVFVGLTGMYDPPRAEVKNAVKLCSSAGIRVVMITGDQPHTALAIARELGIATSKDIVMSGFELDKISEEELRNKATSIAVFARVTAEHKLRIVNAWKSNNAVVAMTGDGVNDAPAIKGADIGIAMGRSGTEVTKQAADMIITDDNFSSIVSAVEEGRGIYNNIRKTMQYLLAGNIGEILLMAICVVIGLPMPLLPIHLLWINLVTDGLPALCLVTDPIDKDVMDQKPRARNERITDGGFFLTMFLTGILTAGTSFGVYIYGLNSETPELAQTYAFTVLVFAELFRAFGARSETRPVWKINLFSNFKLFLVIFISIAFQIWSHHNEFLAKFFKTSLVSFSDCIMLIIVSLLPLLVIECVKWARQILKKEKK
jgi:Ca2+-transporting ATPase